MATRRVAVVTLVQKEDESPQTEAVLEKQIRQAISSSILAKTWKIDHVAFLDDTMTSQENIES